MIRRRFANAKLEISVFLFAFRQRLHRFARLKDVSNILFARGMSLRKSA